MEYFVLIGTLACVAHIYRQKLLYSYFRGGESKKCTLQLATVEVMFMALS